ncbi:MAG: tRNA (adenosine(37)-N6)-dimethylallyltransferase MiaA [bacterium]|nr:tRNA (adenosine(37)-N6)-dimethylallyltransferase MiaA [bacterium]
MKDIIVIVGPTGIGKTKLSISLAKIYDAEIINGDSVSIYKKLDIGSAKPTVEEMDGVVHHLIDIKNLDEDYSIYDYQKDVRQKIDEITRRGKRVIIVGGSGLYLKAALYDYRFDCNTSNNLYEDLTNEEILSKIKRIDNNIDIHVNNRKRLIRTLNKLESEEKITNNKDDCLYPVKIIGLTTSRDILYDRINKRVDLMINNGLVDEVISLKEDYNNSRVLNTAIGYKEFYDYLFNNKALSEVTVEIKKNSRHFAKRQYTFFNHQMNVEWFSVNFDDFSITIEEIKTYLDL